MKFGKNSVSSSHEDHSASRNTPIWTIPDLSSSQANNTIDPPSFKECNPSSRVESTDLPPNYFDISVVSNRTVFNSNEANPLLEPSKVKIERKNEGVLSFDPMLDTDPDQLWLYFITYLNEKPSMTIQIHGWHTEMYSVKVEGIHGRPSHTEQRTRSITDFNFDIDLTEYISKQWRYLSVIPSDTTNSDRESNSFRDALEQYARSEKSIKQIQCRKHLTGWDFNQLKEKIKQIVFSTGYNKVVTISFSTTNQSIVARSSSRLSRFANSNWMPVLCVFSVFCPILCPIYLCLRSKRSIDRQINVDYKMISSSDAFLYANAATIANGVVTRSHQTYSAKPALS